MGAGGSNLQERSLSAARESAPEHSMSSRPASGIGQPRPAADRFIQIFETMPARVYVDRVRAHIADTGLPETFPGLHPGPIARDEPFRILSPISIPRAKRPLGDKAPCPMCQPNKFYEGKVVYFFKLKAVAIIGHCCASAVTRNEAQLEYDAREALERAEGYLLEWLPQVPRALERALALQPAVVEAQRVYDRFRKDGGHFQHALRKAVRGGEELTATEVIGSALPGGPLGMRTSGSTVQTRDIRFGRLEGQVAVAATCTIATDLEKCISALRTFDRGSDEDAAIEFIVALGDSEKVECSKRLEAAIGTIGRVGQCLAGFRVFFSAANLGRISRWGTHAEAPVALVASLRPFGSHGEMLFEVKGDGRRFGIVIDSDLWTSSC